MFQYRSLHECTGLRLRQQLPDLTQCSTREPRPHLTHHGAMQTSGSLRCQHIPSSAPRPFGVSAPRCSPRAVVPHHNDRAALQRLHADRSSVDQLRCLTWKHNVAITRVPACVDHVHGPHMLTVAVGVDVDAVHTTHPACCCSETSFTRHRDQVVMSTYAAVSHVAAHDVVVHCTCSLDDNVRLRSEAEAPFRSLRLVLYGFSVVSASIGTLISIPQLIGALNGAPNALAVDNVLQNIGTACTGHACTAKQLTGLLLLWSCLLSCMLSLTPDANTVRGRLPAC